MVHDMAFTEKYALLFDLPVTFNLDDAMSGTTLPYRWNDEYGARIGLLPRERRDRRSDVRWFDIEPCYVFHPLNAYDLEDGSVVLDAVRHPKMFATDVHGPNEGRDAARPVDDRSDRGQGARGDDRRPGPGVPAPQRDAPGAAQPLRLRRRLRRFDEGEAAPAIKHDLVAGTTAEHDYGAGRITLEPVFVPREGATAEDDGWVMSYVYDATTDRSDVVILDAQDFTGDPVATIQLPVRVPFGFHGNWIPTP